MKTTTFALATLATIFSANLAHAGSTCMAQTYSGKIITIAMNSVGTMGYVQGGSVEIKNARGQIETQYNLTKNEIPQYFESCRDLHCKTAIIGLSAYKDHNYTVSINFVGADHFNLAAVTPEYSLEAHLLNPKRRKDAGNSMRVWMGDERIPYENAFYEFTDVVCQLDHDV